MTHFKFCVIKFQYSIKEIGKTYDIDFRRGQKECPCCQSLAGCYIATAAAAAKLLHSCPTMCSPIDSSPPVSSIPGILQARVLEWVAISFSNTCMHAKLLQSCLTLCDPMDSSPPGSSVHRILQARILERVAISFSSNQQSANQRKEMSQNSGTGTKPLTHNTYLEITLAQDELSWAIK